MIFICVSKIFIFNKKLYYEINQLFISILNYVCFNLYAQSDKDKDEKKVRKQKLTNKQMRFFELSTNTGSWMSLDVSPDGQTIVFDLLGDIYSIPITGGKAKRITKGMQFDSHPKFSPDGKSLAMLVIKVVGITFG